MIARTQFHPEIGNEPRHLDFVFLFFVRRLTTRSRLCEAWEVRNSSLNIRLDIPELVDMLEFGLGGGGVLLQYTRVVWIQKYKRSVDSTDMRTYTIV